MLAVTVSFFVYGYKSAKEREWALVCKYIFYNVVPKHIFYGVTS